MEMLVTDVNWLAVVVGAIIAYVFGGLWYSEKMFVKKWMAGIGTPAVKNTPKIYGMSAQAVGTFLFAWVIGVTEKFDLLPLAILITLTIASLIKANGFFGGKTKYAIFVESFYVLVMGTIMILTHSVL